MKDKELYRQFRRVLSRDLNLVRQNRYRRGYRQTNLCEICGESVYSKKKDEWIECWCGDVKMRENSFFYIIDCKVSVDNSDSVMYDELREENLKLLKGKRV